MSSPSVAPEARRTWGQRAVILVNSVVVVVALVLAATLGYFNTKLAHLQRLSLGQVLTAPASAPGSPQNYLLVGTDSDAGLPANDHAVQGRGNVGGARSDTIMILHVDPRTTQAMLLSLPRDLWVTIAGTGTKQKINAAIEVGGPKALIETIEQNFHIPINHYVEIDFRGFKQVVSAVGGIPVYFNVPFRDLDHTGLNITKPGCYVLNADDALNYARARYVQYYVDGYWHDDGTADLGRISRQQDFMKKALKRSVAKGIRNPVVLNELVDAGLAAVTVDDKLTSGDLLDLGGRFRSFDPDNLQTIELPVQLGTAGGQSIVTPLPASRPILDLFRGIDPAAQSPVNVTVQVFNGTGRYNEATDVSAALRKVGFQTGAPSDERGTTGGPSLIRYAPGDEATARFFARYLDSDVTFAADTDLESGKLQLVTGRSFQHVLSTPKDAASVAGPTTTSTSSTTTTSTLPGATTLPGSSTTTQTAVTSTTIAGFVPDRPPPGVTCG